MVVKIIVIELAADGLLFHHDVPIDILSAESKEMILHR